MIVIIKLPIPLPVQFEWLPNIYTNSVPNWTKGPSLYLKAKAKCIGREQKYD